VAASADAYPRALRGWRNSNPEPTPIRLAVGDTDRLLRSAGERAERAVPHRRQRHRGRPRRLHVRFTDKTYCAACDRGGRQRRQAARADGRPIVAIKVAAGDKVSRGQTLVVLEAMKIQHQLKAALDSRSSRCRCRKASRSSNRAVLVTMAADAAALEGVCHSYGSGRGPRAIDLDIADGETVALIGPSGCGKSTLLGIIGGLLEATAGRVSLSGAPPADSLNPFTYIFQDFALLPWRSVAANVALALEHRGSAPRKRRERVAAALALTGLDRICHGLSQAALRRHAPARRHRPRAGRAAGGAAARRAAVGARRPDARTPDGRPFGHLGAREEHPRLRHPQSRGSRAPRRPRRGAVAPAGRIREISGSTCRSPSAASPTHRLLIECIAGCGR
jgi:hypothetical protein